MRTTTEVVVSVLRVQIHRAFPDEWDGFERDTGWVRYARTPRGPLHQATGWGLALALLVVAAAAASW